MDDLIELRKRIESHPLHAQYQAWDALDRGGRVFRANRMGLIPLLNRFEKDREFAIEVLDISNQEPNRRYMEFQTRLDQGLYNTFSSAASLVAQMRRMHGGSLYKGTSFGDELKSRLKKMESQPVFGFMRAFRNVIEHGSLVAMLNLGEGLEPPCGLDERRVTLSDEFLRNIDWGGKANEENAKAYIAARGDRIAPSGVIKEHGQILSEHMSWMEGSRLALLFDNRGEYIKMVVKYRDRRGRADLFQLPWLHQLAAHYLLDADDTFEIDSVGVVLPRQAAVITWSLEEVSSHEALTDLTVLRREAVAVVEAVQDRIAANARRRKQVTAEHKKARAATPTADA